MGGLKAIRGSPDPQVPGVKMVLKGQRGKRGWLARKDPQARLGRRASWGCQGSRVTQDARALRDLLAFLGPRDH